MGQTLGRKLISTRREKLAELARMEPKRALTTVAHHIDLAWLMEAWRLTRKDGASGIDGVTAAQYEAELEANLASLLERFKSGRYRAPAVRRVYIPKADGGQRPLGIPTLEDKVLQRAVLMALEPIYEQDFLDCSYGFRPGRSAHQALEALWRGLMDLGGGWIIDLDIRSYFDSVDHAELRQLFEHRVRDGVIVRTVGKWLNAGVMEDGAVIHTEWGTPQGGVISPLLSNLYLHEVLDVWFEREVRPRLRGRALMVRYADDAVLAFECEEDARRVLDVLPKRFGKYGLQLHPDKTRLVAFRPPDEGPRGGSPAGSFSFLGFTHFWKRSRKGRWMVARKTAGAKFGAALKRTGAWCRKQRHHPMAEQHAALSRKLQGHYAYYGITGNSRALSNFRYEVERRWRYWLSRRSAAGVINWTTFSAMLRHYPLPPARVIHSVYRRAATA